MNPLRTKILLCWLVNASALYWLISMLLGNIPLTLVPALEVLGLVGLSSFSLTRLKRSLPAAPSRFESIHAAAYLTLFVLIAVFVCFDTKNGLTRATVFGSITLFSISLVEDLARLKKFRANGAGSITVEPTAS